jgi:hypothetical protein
MNLITHPIADLFPMMGEDELADLADDIKANGLVHAIILDAKGETLIDGRNRLRACELAQVEPRFERLNGQDPTAFIISVNLARRNLSKGQQAMALAFIYPEPEKAYRGKKSDQAAKLLETKTFSGARLSQARTVLRHSRTLGEAVLAGVEKLDAAIAKVEAEREQAMSTAAQMARLEAEASDLADLVFEERLTLAEAIAALNKRIADAAQLREVTRENIIRSVINASNVASWATPSFTERLVTELEDQDFRRRLAKEVSRFREYAGLFAAGAENLKAFLASLEE